MGMGYAPTWLRQVNPPPASQNHFNHWVGGVHKVNILLRKAYTRTAVAPREVHIPEELENVMVLL